MTTNHSHWGRWLLVTLFALFAITFLWRHPERDRRAAGPADQIVTSHVSLDPAQSTSHTPAVVPRPTIPVDGFAAVPIKFQLAGVGRVRTAASFREWLAQFPLDQQAKISAFNKAHFGVYRVNSREQVAWLAANGYPMPEDIIAAETLSDKDLFKLANQGNDKATFLLAERQNRELVDFLAKGGKKSAYFEGVKGRDRSNAQMTIDRLVRQSSSPYKGYIQASEAISGLYADQDQAVTDVHVIAGLIWAEQLGDLRASQFLSDYIAEKPGQREVISAAATAAALNDSSDMQFMARQGCQHPGAKGLPGGDAPVH